MCVRSFCTAFQRLRSCAWRSPSASRDYHHTAAIFVISPQNHISPHGGYLSHREAHHITLLLSASHSSPAECCMGKAERIKLSDAQKAAIDDYNRDLQPADKVNKHYSAERAQWLNDNVFAPADVELVPVPAEEKLKKAQRDARRNSQPSASMSRKFGFGGARSGDDEDITFNVSMSRDSFIDPLKDIITEQLGDLKSELFTKSDGKKLLKEFDVHLSKFGQVLTKSIATMLVSDNISPCYISPNISLMCFIIPCRTRAPTLHSPSPPRTPTSPLPRLQVLLLRVLPPRLLPSGHPQTKQMTASTKPRYVSCVFILCIHLVYSTSML